MRPLSHRLYDVAKLVAEQDLGYKEIAWNLNLAHSTVKGRYMEKIFDYFGVHSRLALALEWSKHRFYLRDWESYLAWHRINKGNQ